MASDAPTKLQVTGVPPNTTADQLVPFTVTALDATGAPSTTFSGIAAVSSNDPLAVFSSTLQFSNGLAQGVVRFRTSGPKALHVAAQGETIARGSGVTRVASGPAAATRFTRQPSSITAGFPMVSRVWVTASDVFGNGVPGVMVSVSARNDHGTAELLGLTRQTTFDDGTAFFEPLIICRAGTGYTLVASSSGLEATSDAFDVRPGDPRSSSSLRHPQPRPPARR